MVLHPQASKVAPRDPDVKKKLAECEKEVKRQRFEEALSLPVSGMEGQGQEVSCCGPEAVLRRDHDRGWEGAWKVNRPGRQCGLSFSACSSLGQVPSAKPRLPLPPEPLPAERLSRCLSACQGALAAQHHANEKLDTQTARTCTLHRCTHLAFCAFLTPACC